MIKRSPEDMKARIDYLSCVIATERDVLRRLLYIQERLNVMEQLRDRSRR